MKKKLFATICVAVLLVMSTTIFASAKNYSNWFDLDRINAVDVETNLKNEATREEVALIVAYVCDDFDALPSKAVLDFEDEDDFESRSSYKTVTRLSSTGIVNGYPDETFGPENDITRAEALTIILRMVDYLSIETESYHKGSSFTDTEGHWAEVYIERAYEQGLVSGRGDGRFYPQDNITREEVITIMVNLMGESNNPLIAAIDKVYDLEFDNSYYEEEVEEEDDDESSKRPSRYDDDEDEDEDYEEATKRPVIDLDDYDEDDEENDNNHSSKPQRPVVVLDEDEDEVEEDDDNDRPSRPVVNISSNTTTTSSSKPSRPVVDTTDNDSSNRTSRPVVDTTTTNDRPTVVVDSGDNEGSSNRPSRPRV